MTIYDSVNASLPELRAQAEALMVDRVTIQRHTGEATYDEATGLAGQASTTIGTGRPCKFTKDQRGGRAVSAAETTVLVTSTRVKFPHDEDIEVGDLLTVTAAQETADIGRLWRITDVERHTWHVARSCTVEEIAAPELHL